MKLSTRVRFGVRIMLQVSLESQAGLPVLARRIAVEQNISEAYVDQILIPLRSGGLLKSRRGRCGGYHLARPAQEITILEIVEILEGKITLIDCITVPDSCDRGQACVTRSIWERLAEAIRSSLGEITLADLRDSQQKNNPVIDFTI